MTPPIVTVRDPKSLVFGVVPKLTPVNKALCVPPKLAPAGWPTVSTALVDKFTLLMSRLLDELNDNEVPLTDTVRSVVPSMDWSCVCKLLARSVKLAVAGAGVSVCVTPPTLIVNVLKSLTDELAPKLKLAIEAVAATVGSVEIPADEPTALALGVKAMAEIDLPVFELKLKAPLTTLT